MWKRIVSSILSSSTPNNLNNRNSASSETLRGESESLQSLVSESSNVGERVHFFEEAIASRVQLPVHTPVRSPSITQRLANATPEEIVLEVDPRDIIRGIRYTWITCVGFNWTNRNVSCSHD